MELTSISFSDNERIPVKYTCDGDNINPPLTIQDPPMDTESFVLIMEDPDAPGGDFIHWLMFNIPSNTRDIAENSVPQGAIMAENDFGNNDYGGPCPPTGTHRYLFKVYALSKKLDLDETASREEIEEEMEDSIIDEKILIGLYSRITE